MPTPFSSALHQERIVLMREDAVLREAVSVSAARAAKPAAHASSLGDRLGHALERGRETQERHERPEQPHREIKRADREDNSASAGELEDRTGLAPLGCSKPRKLRDVAR